MIALVLLLLFAPMTQASGGHGMELTLSKAYGESLAPHPIVGLTYFKPRFTPLPGFSEWGLTFQPPGSGPDSNGKSFFGMYAGHLFVPFHEFVRPGFQLGWMYREGGEAKSLGQTLSFYWGVHVQVSCLTFILTREGWGGGINFKL